MRKRKPQEKYEWLHDILGLYGVGILTAAQFWSQMNVRGYGQRDIDDWCAEYHKRSEDNAEQTEGEQSRTARNATARDAREEHGEERVTEAASGEAGDEARREDDQKRRTGSITTDQHRADARRWAAIIYSNHVANGRAGCDTNHIAANISYEETLRRGLLAELVFADEFSLEVNAEILDYGDGGKDFALPLFNGRDVCRYPINVKAKSVQVSWPGLLRSGTHLRVPVKQVLRDVIYVFAIYLEREDRAEVLRWAWGRSMIERNERLLFENGNGEESYVVPFEELRDLQELHDRHRLALKRLRCCTSHSGSARRSPLS